MRKILLSKYQNGLKFELAKFRHGIVILKGENRSNNQKCIFMQKKAIGLLLAAAAAYGYYRYSKMTPDQKKKMMQKRKDLLKDNFGGIADFFGTKKAETAGARSNM